MCSGMTFEIESVVETLATERAQIALDVVMAT